MPAEKSVHLTLKLNIPMDAATAAMDPKSPGYDAAWSAIFLATDGVVREALANLAASLKGDHTDGKS